MKSLSDAKFFILNSMNRTSNKKNKKKSNMILNTNSKGKMDFQTNYIDCYHHISQFNTIKP